MKIQQGKQEGFSLIEGVIAMLIVSFGLISISGLYLRLQQFNSSSYWYTQATIITHDMIERMRANPLGLSVGLYNQGRAISHHNCYAVVGCRFEEMAENDSFEWMGDSVQAMTARLPQGKGIVCVDSTPYDGTVVVSECDNVGSIYAIKVWWRPSQGGVERLVTTVQL